MKNSKRFVTGENAGNKINQLGIFRFRTILDIAMLFSNNENAKIIRSKILDIVIDVLAQKTGGNTKYINQKDPDYLPNAILEIQNRKKFTEALSKYVVSNKYKYANLTNVIYECLFKENAKEYKKILELSEKNTVKSTLYSEVLVEISAYEVGVAYEIEKKYSEINRLLTVNEVKEIIVTMFNHPMQKPRIQNVRTKMASRDLNFRDALHQNLKEYITEIPPEDFDKFLNDQIEIVGEKIEENKEIFERLKDK